MLTALVLGGQPIYRAQLEISIDSVKFEKMGSLILFNTYSLNPRE